MPIEFQPTQTQPAEDPFEGRRKVYVGGINGEGEQEISLERFESMPLSTFVTLRRALRALIESSSSAQIPSFLENLDISSTSEVQSLLSLGFPVLPDHQQEVTLTLLVHFAFTLASR